MRRLILPLTLALIGLLGFGSIAPLPSVHAQTAVPALAASPNPASVGSTTTITGQNFTPNNWAYVSYQRPDGTVGYVFAPTTGGGTLSFTLGFTAAHGTGNEYVRAYDYGTGRWTSALTVVVSSTTPVPVRQVTASNTTPAAGSTITLSGSGFTPNNWVYVYFQRPNGTVGAFWAYTSGAGSFTSSLGFNAANGCGTESIYAYDYAAGQWSAPVTVTVTGCNASTPAAPSNLRIVSSTVDQAYPQYATVTLQWTDNSSNETGFRVRTTLTHLYGGSDPQVQEVGANTTTAQVRFVAGGFNPVKTACFTVTAFNASGESASSNQVCVQYIQ